MPLSLSLAERLLLRAGVIPAPVVDVVYHASYRLLLAGYRLGVFDALAAGPLDLETLSARVGAERAALAVLLDLLRRLGYLSLRGGRYANTTATRRWLTRSSPDSLEGIVPFLADLIGRWEYLEETIKAGQPPRNAYDFYRQHPERWQSFHDGQRALASFTAGEVARKARLPAGPARLIDIGGSHGLYTMALCRRYPGLSAVIYDWPEGVAAAQREIARSDMGGRVATVTGDFFADDLGHGYDVALLGNIIHGQKPPAIMALLERVRGALRPGGTLLIVDQVAVAQPFTRFAAYTARLVGLILLNELGGGVYPYADVRRWLLRAGYRDVRLRRLLGTPGFALIQATAR